MVLVMGQAVARYTVTVRRAAQRIAPDIMSSLVHYATVAAAETIRHRIVVHTPAETMLV
jgi:hypothetical protein